MKTVSRKGFGVLIAAAVAMGIMAGSVGEARADAITKVSGIVTDEKGNPVAKVPIYFEAVDIKKTIGPVKTNKRGKYVISTLDRSVAKKWRVAPRMKGYKTVKIQFVIIDSTGTELLNGENIIGTKQEHPDFQLALVGNLESGCHDVGEDPGVLAADLESAIGAARLGERRHALDHGRIEDPRSAKVGHALDDDRHRDQGKQGQRPHDRPAGLEDLEQRHPSHTSGESTDSQTCVGAVFRR